MNVPTLQYKLENHYDLQIPYCVEQFVSHDREIAHQLALESAGSNHNGETILTEEVMFIRQDDSNLEFTVFFDPELMRVLGSEQPPTLDNLCTVVEGVSHAVCLLWHAHHRRQIRPLDLELQAEIDKYVILIESCDTAAGRRLLHDQLFSRCAFISSDNDVHDRYRTANQFAAHYCQWLEHQYLEPMAMHLLHYELARFYRLSGVAKMEYIQSLH